MLGRQETMPHFISEACTGCTNCKILCPANAVDGKAKARHRIDSLRCIDCGACGITCPAEAVLDGFGKKVGKIGKKDRKYPVFDFDVCMSCGICFEACPAGAIAMDLQKVGDLHPYPYLTSQKRCISCGFCVQDCPVDAVVLNKMKIWPIKAKQAGGQVFGPDI